MTIEIVLIALALGVLTGFLVAGALKSQLKTVRPENAAGNYVRPGSLILTHSTNLYLYSNVTRTPRPKNNDRSNK